MTKVCTNCLIEKDAESDFYKNRCEKDGRQYRCKLCCSKSSKEYNAIHAPCRYAMTLEEIASKLGVSRQAVHSLEQSAFRKLRKFQPHRLEIMREEAERVSLRRYQMNQMEPA